MSLEPDGVWDVADLLATQQPGDDMERWLDRSAYRYRSSVSRAYYSLFHALRELAETERRGFKLAEDECHAIVRDALDASQDLAGDVYQAFKDLRMARRKADYDPAEPHQVETAQDALTKADTALEIIGKWDATTRGRVAMEMAQAQARRGSRRRPPR